MGICRCKGARTGLGTYKRTCDSECAHAHAYTERLVHICMHANIYVHIRKRIYTYTHTCTPHSLPSFPQFARPQMEDQGSSRHFRLRRSVGVTRLRGGQVVVAGWCRFGLVSVWLVWCRLGFASRSVGSFFFSFSFFARLHAGRQRSVSFCDELSFGFGSAGREVQFRKFAAAEGLKLCEAQPNE